LASAPFHFESVPVSVVADNRPGKPFSWSCEGHLSHHMSAASCFTVAVLFVVEWSLAVMLITVIKALISNPAIKFPYPLFATFLMNGWTGVLAFLCEQTRRALTYAQIARGAGLSAGSIARCFVKGLTNVKPRIGLRDFMFGLAPLGLMMGIEIGLSNAALHLLTMSFKTIVHACGPAVVMLSARTLGLERCTAWIALSLLFILAGGGCAYIGSVVSVGSKGEVSMPGLLLALGALFMQGIRWSVSQILLKRGSKLHLGEEDRSQILAKLTGSGPVAKPSAGSIACSMYPESANPDRAFKEHLLRHPSCDEADSGSVSTGVASRDAGQKGVFTGLEAAGGLSEADAPRRRALSSVNVPPELMGFVKKRIGSKTSHITKIEIAALTNPLTALVCLLLACVFEPAAFSTPSMGWTQLGGTIMLCSSLVLMKMALDLYLIQLTSAFTFSLAGVAHNLIIILAGVLCFGERPTELAWLGFASISLGIIVYAWQKATAAH